MSIKDWLFGRKKEQEIVAQQALTEAETSLTEGIKAADEAIQSVEMSIQMVEKVVEEKEKGVLEEDMLEEVAKGITMVDDENALKRTLSTLQLAFRKLQTAYFTGYTGVTLNVRFADVQNKLNDMELRLNIAQQRADSIRKRITNLIKGK